MAAACTTTFVLWHHGTLMVIDGRIQFSLKARDWYQLHTTILPMQDFSAPEQRSPSPILKKKFNTTNKYTLMWSHRCFIKLRVTKKLIGHSKS
jgi:hypothetical protein